MRQAKIAYDAYAKKAGLTTTFDDLSQHLKEAWAAAAHAVEYDLIGPMGAEGDRTWMN